MAVDFMAKINSGHGLNVWTNADILQIGLSGIHFSEFLFYQLWDIYFQENVFEDVVYKMTAVLSRCVIYGSLLTG